MFLCLAFDIPISTSDGQIKIKPKPTKQPPKHKLNTNTAIPPKTKQQEKDFTQVKCGLKTIELERNPAVTVGGCPTQAVQKDERRSLV